ncbi:MAG: acyl-CoA thioesterase [Desulfococcaceae bacterium]
MTQGRIHEIPMKVAFHDLDPLQIVRRGNYLKYCDIARFALFRAGGIDLCDRQREKMCFFP